LNGDAYCLDASTGGEQWIYEAQIGDTGYSTSCIAISGPYAYFSAHTLLYCIG